MNDVSTHRYILSAGRVGTVYLEKLINEKLPTAHAMHEPADTRYLMMLANLRNEVGIGNALLSRLFERGRSERERMFGPCYVEINPFLCAFTDILPAVADSLRVVHVVRDPADWARSIHAFKASTRYRQIIDFVPFSKPFPSPRPARWQNLSGYEKALWRWNWCNDKIASIADRCATFTVIRYEDLFSSDIDICRQQLETVVTTLDLPGSIVVSDAEIHRRENAFNSLSVVADRDAARRICREPARAYGYDY